MSVTESYGDYHEEIMLVRELTVDPRVQRPLDTRKVQRIVETFNPSAIGILTVSSRKDGSNVVLDGQTRLEAVRRVSEGDGRVPCRIFKDLSLDQEARIFLDLNTTTKPSRIDAFQVKLVAKDETSLEIDKIIHPWGWDVKSHAKDGYIQAIAAIEKIYAKSVQLQAEPNLLDMTIRTITKAWGINRDGVQAGLLLAVASLYAAHGSNINFDRLVDVLKSWEGGPVGLHTQGKAHANTMRMRVYHGISGMIVSVYNRGLSRNKLDEWRYNL